MKKKIKAGLIFWSVFAIVIVVCFLIAKGRIANVLKETDFFNEVTGSEPAVITDLINSNETISSDESTLTGRPEILKKSKKIKSSKSDSKTEKTSKLSLKKKTTENSNDEPVIQDERTDEQILSKITEIEEAEKLNNKSLTQTEEKVVIADAKESSSVKTMNLNICLVQIAGDGSIVRREVIRTVEKNSSPLTTAINLLLKGPVLEELGKGYISVIPENSVLISARVTNKTAILNFNEEFTCNSYGVQGQIAQLMQIVYTATSFSTIDNVQFLINGEKIEYLGGEGVWIGSPLSRFSFK